MEGTNEDDLHVYRPGLKAVRELKVYSPLADAGLTKPEVRELAMEYGLSVSNDHRHLVLPPDFPMEQSLILKSCV